MEYERKNPDCKITVPDKITVRQQLEYFSLAGAAAGREMLIRYWEGAKALITDWQCELLPDMRTDLDKVTNPDVVSLIVWAGTQVKRHVNALEDVPKN